MEISFKSRKDQKTFNEYRTLKKEYGDPMAKTIQKRMAVLKNAPTLFHVQADRTMRLHPLKGNRNGQFAVNLKHPFRLVFIPNHDTLPTTEDGAVDLSKITAITILEVIDYH